METYIALAKPPRNDDNLLCNWPVREVVLSLEVLKIYYYKSINYTLGILAIIQRIPYIM